MSEFSRQHSAAASSRVAVSSILHRAELTMATLLTLSSLSRPHAVCDITSQRYRAVGDGVAKDTVAPSTAVTASKVLEAARIATSVTTEEIPSFPSFTLDVKFPDLFARYLEFLNVLAFDMFGTIR